MTIDGSACVADLQHMSDELHAVARQALGQAANVAVRAAKSTTTFKDHTSKLRGSIRRVDVGDWKIRVVASAKYALYVEGGTKPHQILPKAGGLLRFVIGNRVVFARSVKHPGTKATHFMQDARDIADAAVGLMLETGVSRVTQGR